MLSEGAIITLGKTTIRYRDPAAAALGGAAAMLVADTHTKTTGTVIPVDVPPRWPIAVAAVVAAAAFAMVIVLLAGG